jgi:hypothetical protein
MTPQGAAPNDKKSRREALGRSRGGLTTKIHLAADQRCRPITRLTSSGQHGDSPRFIPVLEQISIARRGRGRPRSRPGRAMGDRAYSSAANRAYLRRRGIKAVIPVKEDQKSQRSVRWPAACVRHRLAQTAQYRRALLQQAEAVPRRRGAMLET